jgi:hypothetical protein
MSQVRTREEANDLARRAIAAAKRRRDIPLLPFGSIEDKLNGWRRATKLMQKFHHETDCGKPHHWHECEMFAHANGYESWEDWQAAYERSGEVA